MCDPTTLRCVEPTGPSTAFGLAAILAAAPSVTAGAAPQVDAAATSAALEASATAAQSAAATIMPSAPAVEAPTATPAPQPSSRFRVRRHVAPSCAGNLTACSIDHLVHQTLGRRSRTYECVDTQTNLEKCGGCARGPGDGVDCTELDAQGSVACVEGVCVVSDSL